MNQHEDFKFSVTIHTDDLALLGCLRALCQHCQETGNARIGWAGTNQEDWASGGHKATFRFTAAFNREQFLSEAERLLPKHLWQKVSQNDNDPATPQTQPAIQKKSRIFDFSLE